MTTISEVVLSLEEAYQAIRERHPEVPPALVVVGPSNDSRGLKLGHWARNSWQGEGDERVHELFVTAEWLERPAAEIFGTILHEAAHALATARDVSDCVRQRHNGNFKKLAEELGMTVQKHSQPSRGWAHTTPTAETLAEYKKEIAGIASAVKAYRAPIRVVRDAGKAAKAKVSSAKSMAKWLASSDPVALAGALATSDNAAVVLAALAKELGAACANCGTPLAD
jgi:hypothetical protein